MVIFFGSGPLLLDLFAQTKNVIGAHFALLHIPYEWQMAYKVCRKPSSLRWNEEEEKKAACLANHVQQGPRQPVRSQVIEHPVAKPPFSIGFTWIELPGCGSHGL